MKKLLSVFLFLVVFVSSASATSYTCVAGTDPWATAASWTPSGVPGAGDTVTIQAGCTVNGSASDIIGVSGASGTTAVTMTGGTWNINGLNLRGDVAWSGGAINVIAGGNLVFNSSLATTPLSQKYKFRASTAGLTMSFNGSTGSHVTVSSNTSGGHGYFDDGVTSSELTNIHYNVTYADFTAVGDAAIPALKGNSFNGATVWSMDHMTTDTTSGDVRTTYNVGNSAGFVLTNSNMKGSTDHGNGLSSMRMDASVAKTTGTRNITGNYFLKQVEFIAPIDVTMSSNVLDGGMVSTVGAFASFDNNFLHIQSQASDTVVQGVVTNNIMFGDSGTSSTNNHHLQANQTTTFTGNLWEDNTTGGIGVTEHDAITLGSSSNAGTVITITGSLILCTPGGDTSGTLFSALANSNITINANHNTYCAGSEGAAVGETYTGYTGMLTSFKSNIAFSLAASSGYKLYDSGTNDNVVDLVTAANADYNTGYNLLTGSNLKGYNALEFSTGSPGAHDIDVNPQFVDGTRDLKTYDGMVNSTAGSFSNLITELRKTGLSTFNSAYVPSTISTWIKNGFKVQNASLNNAGHDGVTIGSQAYQLAPTPTFTSTPASTATFTVTPVPTATFTPTITPTFTATRTPTITPTFTQTFTATPTITPTPTPTVYVVPSAVPSKQAWMDQWVTWSPRMYNYMVANNGWTSPSDQAAVNQFRAQYYDMMRNMLIMPAIVGQPSLAAARIAVMRRVYRESYVYPNNGASSGIQLFTGGLRADSEMFNDTRSKDAVQLLHTNSVFMNSPLSSTADPNGVTSDGGGRENAYRIMADLDARALGFPGNSNLNAWLDQALLHLNTWTVTQTSSYVKPFMVAIVAKAVIQAYEEYPAYPSRGNITNAVGLAYDYIWDHCWVPYNSGDVYSRSFNYADRELGDTDPPDLRGSPDLNGLIVPTFGWLYKQTQLPKWAARGDEVFLGTITNYDMYGFHVSGPNFGSSTDLTESGKKQFDQTYQWSYKYVTWREQPFTNPTPTPTPVPTVPGGTPTPRPTPFIVTLDNGWRARIQGNRGIILH